MNAAAQEAQRLARTVVDIVLKHLASQYQDSRAFRTLVEALRQTQCETEVSLLLKKARK